MGWLGASVTPILSFVKIVAVGKEVFSSMSALGEQLGPLVQECCVLWRLWFRYIVLNSHVKLLTC